MPNREEAERRLERLFTAVAAWASWIQQPPLVASPGSSLAADDQAFPSLPASTIAYNGLVTAVEHLDYFRTALQAVADRVIATLDARLDEAAALATSLGKNPANIRKWKFDMTRAITEAVGLANPVDTADAAVIRSGTGLLWRSQSGHAHGTPGSRLSLIDHGSVVDGGNGTLWGAASTSFEQVVTATGAATLLLDEAWRLYDLRRESYGDA
jgi:hypothetical protein